MALIQKTCSHLWQTINLGCGFNELASVHMTVILLFFLFFFGKQSRSCFLCDFNGYCSSHECLDAEKTASFYFQLFFRVTGWWFLVMTVFLTVTLLLHVKRSARLRLCASLAAGMSVSEHDLGHGQAANTEHQHTQIVHAQTHRNTDGLIDTRSLCFSWVPTKMQRCNTFPRDCFLFFII